jgi:AcrR family transcriptional regulator
MPYRTTRKMAQRKQAHRRALILAAIALLAQRGYHATSVRMIAKAARSSTGGFYFHFRNKADVCAVILELFAEVIARVLQRAAASPRPAMPQQLYAAVRDLVLLMTENPDAARILIMESSSALDARIEKIRREIAENSARLFQQLLAKFAPALPAPDSALAPHCIVGSIYQSVYHWLTLPLEQRPAAGALASAVADFNLHGVVAPQTQHSSEKGAQPMNSPAADSQRSHE